MAGRKIKITSIDTADDVGTSARDLAQQLDSHRQRAQPQTSTPAKTRAAKKKPPPPSTMPSSIATLDTLLPEEEHTASFWLKFAITMIWLGWLIGLGILLFSILKIHSHWQNFTVWQWTGLSLLMLAPALLIWLTGTALGHLTRLSRLGETLSRNIDTLTAPDIRIIEKSRTMHHAILKHTETINKALDNGLGRLATMDDLVSKQAEKMATANDDTRQTAAYIMESIQEQNVAMSKIEQDMNARLGALSETMSRISTEISNTTAMSNQKIKEARLALEGAIAKLNSTSDVVRANTVQAASTLSASHEDIKSLGEIIRQRSHELDEVYKRHGAELTEMIEHLREEQQVLGANMEERLAKMRDLSLSAQTSAESLMQASQTGKETIEALAESASLADTAVKNRFEDMRQMVEYATTHTGEITDMAAKRVQDSLELTRKEISRIEQEMAGLQSRLDSRQNTLDLVPELSKTTPSLQPKKRWTRLKLQPVLDENEEKAQTPIDKGANPVQHPVQPEASQSDEFAQTKLERESRMKAQDWLDDTTGLATQPMEAEPIHSVQIEEAIHRAAPEENKKHTPAHTSDKLGLLRTLFSRKPKQSGSSLDIAALVAPTPQEEGQTFGEDMPMKLEDLGLGANLVVDEGLIIEVAKIRAEQGHLAMSRHIKTRLKSPVKHLLDAFINDKTLSDTAIRFATHIDATIERCGADVEGIRKRMETEAGRAYLLCDAALNFDKT